MTASFETAWSRASDGHTFSNNTDYDHWAARWCDHCQHEAAYRAGKTEFRCDLVDVAAFGRVPAEWQRDDAERWRCTEFREATP